MPKLSNCLIFIFLFLSQFIFAQGGFIIRNYDVKIELKKEGSFHVQEIIKVDFLEPRRGILRDIPLKYNLSHKTSGSIFDMLFAHEIFLSDVKVTGHPYKNQYRGIGLQIRIGDPEIYLTGEQTYIIDYTVENGLLHGASGPEFYWNIIGDQWEVPIEEVSFKISIPQGIPIGEEDFEIRTGEYGSVEQSSSAQWNQNVLTGQSLVGLGNYKGMTAAIRMPVGSIEVYPFYKLLFYHGKFFILPLIMLLSFYFVWRRFGVDTKMADMVAYLPPKGIDSAMAGFAIDIRANMHDVLSMIPYLGHKGYLKIEHQKAEGFFADDDITFIKLKELPVDAPAHQKVFFDGIFECGDRVQLSDLKNTFYTHFQTAQSAVNDAVMNSDYFTAPSKKLYWNSFWVIGLVAVTNAALCFFYGKIFFLILTIIFAIVLMVFAYSLLKRSQHGDMLYREIRGLKKFIKLAEKDKLEFLVKEDPSYFDAVLPYAVAFNCADTWCDKFKGINLPTPTWFHSNTPSFYSSHGIFNAAAFNDTLSQSLTEMRTVMSSRPSSSGSSSGGGGGSFSGGGFGGGGGSSW
ncbi:MAG: DUF2207 domain-containing protein [Saprospiraceae bacterium]|nr:DUF2207 domain-containing protein [Saprospiraceae bacterium]